MLLAYFWLFYCCFSARFFLYWQLHETSLIRILCEVCLLMVAELSLVSKRTDLFYKDISIFINTANKHKVTPSEGSGWKTTNKGCIHRLSESDVTGEHICTLLAAFLKCLMAACQRMTIWLDNRSLSHKAIVWLELSRMCGSPLLETDKEEDS